MAYTKTNWVNRQGTNLNLYAKSSETPTSVVLTNTPTVTRAGTPFTAENMNKMEQGIYEAHQGIDAFGYLVPFEFQPTALELSAWRCLPLQGQIIQISMYQRLCDKKYVGDAANATADWWYKTSDAAGAVRDPYGAYMRVLDHRGLFSRAAGQNSKYKMANDAPYDGKSIGEQIGDTIRNIAGDVFTALAQGDPLCVFAGSGGCFYLAEGAKLNQIGISGLLTSDTTRYASLRIDASRVVPTALENRPASVSAYLCIKY
jgi:hypothetical protein